MTSTLRLGAPRILSTKPVLKAAAICLAALVLTTPASAQSAGSNDPRGDTAEGVATEPDVTGLGLEVTPQGLLIQLDFSAPPPQPNPGGLTGIAGFIDLDTDANPLTGQLASAGFLSPSPSSLGAELQIPLSSYRDGQADLVDAESGAVLGAVSMQFSARSLSAEVPTSMLGDPAGIRATATVGTRSEFTDAVPNQGYVSTESASASAVLLRNRFSVEVRWTDFSGNSGVGQVAHQATDSALFWFFDAANWELLVKVLDGCAINGHYWLYAGATTDVEYELRVTDTSNGTVRTYTNGLGERQPFIGDTSAFATCP